MIVLRALRVIYMRMLGDQLKKWEDTVSEGKSLETRLNAMNIHPYGRPPLAKHTYPGSYCFINTEYIIWRHKRYERRKFGKTGMRLYALLFVYSALNAGLMKYNEIIRDAVYVLQINEQSYNSGRVGSLAIGVGSTFTGGSSIAIGICTTSMVTG